MWIQFCGLIFLWITQKQRKEARHFIAPPPCFLFTARRQGRNNLSYGDGMLAIYDAEMKALEGKITNAALRASRLNAQ